jgi:DNA repair protein SbcD/Mre11
MRFLHTGDWHIGRAIRGRSRIDEFAAALDQVIAIAGDEGVDAVLIAGDIYDQRSVTHDADRLIFDALLRLHDKGIPVVSIPGNHDSAVRLEAFAPLLERVGVSLVCRMNRPESGGIIEVPSRDGKEIGLIACLPFVSPRYFSSATDQFEDLARGYIDYDEGMGRLLSAYAGAFRDDAVSVVMGHMFVAGAEPGGGERQVTIGPDYAVSAARLPGTVHYVGLGHIHKPQSVRRAPSPTRYCGSLLQLDFGERRQDKSVVVVEAKPGRRATTRAVPVTAGRRLEDVAGTLDELAERAETIGDAYLRVSVKVDYPVPGIADRVREMLPNALDIALDYERDETERPETSLRSLEPREQFVTFYRDHHQLDPAAGLMDAFDRVYDEVTG